MSPTLAAAVDTVVEPPEQTHPGATHHGATGARARAVPYPGQPEWPTVAPPTQPDLDER